MSARMKKYLLIALVVLAALGALYFGVRQYAHSILYHPSAAIVAPTLAGVSAERIETSDGETLVAWYARPQPGQPIFLYFDGNGGAPEMWEGSRWREITAHGAGFLAVYYRGYSGSTGSPSERGLITDARAGYDWLLGHGYTPQDIVIHGFSLGSAVAVQLAAEKPARALVLEAPMTGIDDIASTFAPAGFTGLMRDSFKSRAFVARVSMPVLIAHGDADRVIPFAHGEAMFALAREPKQFVRLNGADHADLPAHGLYDHIWAFLESHPPE
jgi:fermentation-respiration switch protein FrsA (DUF1100 family)